MNKKRPDTAELYEAAMREPEKPESLYRGAITTLWQKGWQTKEISEWLAAKGVQIHPKRIAAYLRENHHRPQQ